MIITPGQTASLSSIYNERFWGVPIYEPALPVLNRSDRVLDMGAGTTDNKVLSTLLARAEEPPCVARLDYSRADLLENSGNGRIRGDAAALPIASGVMSTVITSELTPDNRYFDTNYGWPEQKRNRLNLFTEIARALRLGGHWVAYNEAISPSENRPPGLATVYRRRARVQISPRHMSHHLPFAVFEKIADPIDTGLIGKHVSLEDETYSDDYTRALDEAYPVGQVIGGKLIEAIKCGDISTLDDNYPAFPLYGENKTTLVESAKTGRWTPRLVEFDHPDPHERLAELASPYHYRLTRDRNNPYRKTDKALQEIADIDDFHLNVAGKWAVILPKQQRIDGFVDFRDTAIDAEGIQMRHQKPDAGQ